jgi:hypothetical protein
LTDKLHRSVESLLTNYVRQAFFVSVMSVSAAQSQTAGRRTARNGEPAEYAADLPLPSEGDGRELRETDRMRNRAVKNGDITSAYTAGAGAVMYDHTIFLKNEI